MNVTSTWPRCTACGKTLVWRGSDPMEGPMWICKHCSIGYPESAVLGSTAGAQ